LITQSIHKWRFKNYFVSSRRQGGNLLKGAHGKASFFSTAPHYGNNNKAVLTLNLATDHHQQGIVGVPLCRLPKRCGGGSLLVHFGRYQRYGKGQILVVVDTHNYDRNATGNLVLGLNLIQDASLYAFSSQSTSLSC